MNISLIAAVSKNQVIGTKNTIPWKLFDDLVWFKKNTLNKPVIMGRITYESIGVPLPKRINIVLSNKKHNNTDIIWVSSIKEALLATKSIGSFKEIMIIGGGEIYKQFLPLANKLYLTQINIKVTGDTYFPTLNYKKWKLIFNKYKESDENNKYSFYFKIFTKIYTKT
ncbi:Dihydrofolate reductase [Candidatus Providencia siddallii]|uniref:Dihydrofolate reductase n=1 Tax=Candidatus Providencia siddallii TaxID=1715285 RepID=A0A0M6W802_9GAMM|nr:Dihydrofolate reductase [Candidatus Providencia siddallii]